ncbi:MAG: phosphoribosyltransferase family protein [Candidatus Omnitrophota bacterium]
MFRLYKEAFIRLFYPAACEVCRVGLDLEERILCQDCAEKLDSLAWPMEKTLVEGSFEYLDHTWTVYAYASPVRELLHGVKYARKDYFLKAFRDRAIRLAQAVTSDFWYDAILPIPIDRLKLMKRHFNQAEVLANMIAPWLTPPVKRSLLIKRYASPSQTSLSQIERAINVYGSFNLKGAGQIQGRAFLLLDDVLTTGSTANEAARLLKLHGAKRVDFLALARTATDVEMRSLTSASEATQDEDEKQVTAFSVAKTV